MVIWAYSYFTPCHHVSAFSSSSSFPLNCFYSSVLSSFKKNVFQFWSLFWWFVFIPSVAVDSTISHDQLDHSAETPLLSQVDTSEIGKLASDLRHVARGKWRKSPELESNLDRGNEEEVYFKFTLFTLFGFLNSGFSHLRIIFRLPKSLTI